MVPAAAGLPGLIALVTYPVFVGLDTGGTSNNATVVDAAGRFLVDTLVETPSLVLQGPEAALEALGAALDRVLAVAGVDRSAVKAVGLDTPGPANADGVIGANGATNFSTPPWRGFDIRGALQARLGLPVVYNNDGNVAALYAHHAHFGVDATAHSSVSAIVGTGLGGGVIVGGQVLLGATGQAGELGHVHVPMAGLLEPGQPVPQCNCGFAGDAESVASLTGIATNLLPYWLSRFPDHPLNRVPGQEAAKQVRGYGERGDPMALKIFEQQAKALGRLFTIAANFTDPAAFFVGGGVVETGPEFRDRFLAGVRASTLLRPEQSATAIFALVPDGDMAGARGSAIAARNAML